MIMMTEKLRGTGVAIITPFKNDLSIDINAIENHFTSFSNLVKESFSNLKEGIPKVSRPPISACLS